MHFLSINDRTKGDGPENISYAFSGPNLHIAVHLEVTALQPGSQFTMLE